MLDDSFILIGEFLEVVIFIIIFRYYLGNNLFYFVVCFDILCFYRKFIF